MLYKQMRSSLTLIGFSVLTDVTLTLVLIKSQSELISVPLDRSGSDLCQFFHRVITTG